MKLFIYFDGLPKTILKFLFFNLTTNNQNVIFCFFLNFFSLNDVAADMALKLNFK
jgi:hypothetical protein